MFQNRFASCLLAGLVLVAGPAAAQSTIGYASAILIPLVAYTGSFRTEVFVHNPAGAAPLTLNVTLVEGTTSQVPGMNRCAQLVVPATGSASFDIASQCSLGAGGHFGYMVVQDASAEALNGIFAYTRTQNPRRSGSASKGFPPALCRDKASASMD